MKWAALILMVLRSAFAADLPDLAGVIQTIPLNAAHPYFIPTHPRVTTTIRFPAEIGAPDGSVAVFTEDAMKAGGAEYLVTWQTGDAFFTIAPLKDARMANLNVPFRGRTCVFYFYGVDDPLKAVASVNLVDPGVPPEHATEEGSPVSPPFSVTRAKGPPPDDYLAATPARLLGFLDRLKLLHAATPGPALAALVKAMNVEVAAGRDAASGGQGWPPDVAKSGISAEIPKPLSEGGLFQILLLRAVRDRRINCLGFVCLVRNTSNQVLTFDVNSFGARAGAEYLLQRISDASPVLQPGEQSPAYFIVQPPRGSPLVAGNDWRISIDLVNPRLNPGAVIARGFATLESRK